MFRLRLAAILPPTMLAKAQDGKDRWDLLARKGRLPDIRNRTPFTDPDGEAIWFGRLADDSTFFISGLGKTDIGFACQVTLYHPDYPHGAYDPLPFEWIKKNLFLDQITEEWEKHADYCWFREGLGIEFRIEGPDIFPVSV